MTLIWSFKISKCQTDNAVRFATHDLPLMFYSIYSAILHGNPVFQQMTLIWPFKISKGQTDNAIRFTTHDLLSVFYSNFSVISHGIPVFQQWPWSDLLRSAKVKLMMPSDSWPMTCYQCSIVTIALSRTETMFFSRWPWSDLSRSAKVKLIMPSDSRPMTCY